MNKNMCLFLLMLFTMLLGNSSNQSNDVKTDKSSGLVNASLERNYPNLHLKASIVEGENHRSLFPYAFTRGIRFVFADK